MDPASWSRIWCPYPSKEVFAGYRIASSYVANLLASATGGGANAALDAAFERLCEVLVCRPNDLAMPPWHALDARDPDFPRQLSYLIGRVHCAQSILAALIHFEVSETGKLYNARRTRAFTSTYPNPPAVAHLLAKHITASYVRASSAQDTVALVPRGTRILDPTAETGQLLLAVALEFIRAAHKLDRLDELENLGPRSLLAVDRNPRVVPAIRAMFRILDASVPGLKLGQPRVLVGDSVELLSSGRINGITALVNNPPWGDHRPEVPANGPWSFHKPDSYVDITGRSLDTLEPGARFGLVLPSQFIGSLASASLRSYMTKRTMLSDIRVLPRAAFRHATVRSVTLLGSVPSQTGRNARVNIRMLSRASVGERGTTTLRQLPMSTLRDAGSCSWQPLLMGPATIDRAPDCVPLRSLCDVMTGIKPYKRGAGCPPQDESVIRKKPYTSERPRRGFLPSVRGRHILPYGIEGRINYVRLGVHLAEVGQHPRLLNATRVFVREITDREGTLYAATAPKGILPLHGVITVVPRGLRLAALIAILNSALVAEWLRHHAASQLKVDYQRVTASELLRLPVPIAAANARGRGLLGVDPGRPQSPDYTRLRRLGSGMNAARSARDRHRENEFRAEHDAMVYSLYMGTDS